MPGSPKAASFAWQATAIAQLSYTNNLLLGLTVATLGFDVSELLSRAASPHMESGRRLPLTALFLLSASFVIGLALVVNRLLAFRATMNAARSREQGNSSLAEHRAAYAKFDRWTYRLLWWQIGSYAGGVLATALLMADRLRMP
jgi:hypothetical protein